ncbi:MAG: hypothetical protein J6K14_05505 [Clostridia bacterium]|nr:hypothetical protein [Clostridia bacterium]
MRIDPFFDRQPSPGFIADLSSPVHARAPLGFGKRVTPREGEISVKGLYIKQKFPEGETILSSAYEDLAAFLSVTKVGGDRFPIVIEKGHVKGVSESFRIRVSESGVTVTAEETEGVRRALVYLEEEMTKNEGPFLPLGTVERRPYIKTRMTRGFFSPTNRAPKFGDELLDEVDYYPEAYLNRLAHNGTNGLWIYTSFRALIDMPIFSQNKEEVARRIAKLSRVVERCKRYGVKVFIFAIEPHGITDEEAATHPELLGGKRSNGRHPICLRQEASREYVIGAVEKLFRTVPDLGGYISITAGERTTTCPSVASYVHCPRCQKFSRGENLAYCVDTIKEGIRRAGTGAAFISWTYSHRYWEERDVREYAQKCPLDVVMMQNFEDGGINMQLGKPRVAWDYWLSYVGPCDTYIATAEEAKKRGCEMWAKMQVCNSHELATVPYIPAPGILYDKYKIARELGTTGIMECWYFGNYPSLMSRASGALSFLDTFESKEKFLLEYAARLYGESCAAGVVAAWNAFEAGYKNYPTNVMFNYYGPMHDGVVWKLQLLPKNNPLSRTWLLPDVPDGDRIGECLFRGHTLDEAITLATRISANFQKGLSFLPLPEDNELSTLAGALGILFSSGLNILKFYRLRAALGKGEGNASEILAEMKKIVRAEMENSQNMVAICEKDSRLGYHSEAEGFKFFPEKLLDRVKWLETLLATEFPAVEARIAEGKAPIGYYYAEGENAYRLGDGEIALDEKRAFRVDQTEEGVLATVRCPLGENVTLHYEFDLFMPECGVVVSERPMPTHGESLLCYAPGLGLDSNATSHQSLFGEKVNEELAKHRLEREVREDGSVLYRVFTAVPREKWNRKTAIKLRITIGGKKWIESEDPVQTLGKFNAVPDEYGFILPKKN